MRIDSSLMRHRLRCLLLGILFFSLAGFFQVRSTYGQEASISDFTVSNSMSELLLYLTVTGWFSEEMAAAIQNGIQITFVFNLELAAKRSNWPDRQIREYEFTHVLEYDSLKKVYHVQRQEMGNTLDVASLEEARQHMSEINGFPLLSLGELAQQTSYTVRARAKLARKTMPLYFHYLIPFSSPWDFDTDWHELTLRLAQ